MHFSCTHVYHAPVSYEVTESGHPMFISKNHESRWIIMKFTPLTFYGKYGKMSMILVHLGVPCTCRAKPYDPTLKNAVYCVFSFQHEKCVKSESAGQYSKSKTDIRMKTDLQCLIYPLKKIPVRQPSHWQL